MTELEALSEIGPARARLDERELELIDRARQAGATALDAAPGGLFALASQASEDRRRGHHRPDHPAVLGPPPL